MNKLTMIYGGLLVLTLVGCGKPQDGKAGADGKDGHDGTNASCSVMSVSGTQAPNGGSLISCTDGTSSLVLNGTNGHNGSNGSDGADGQDGTPGSVIKPVQLCAKDETVYPKVFAEVAFCIDKQLYAVYSENNGFLSLIPDGAYQSNAHNSSCQFVVKGCDAIQTK